MVVTWEERFEPREHLCSVAAAVIGAGVATAGAGLVASSNASSAASSAAQTQANAANQATAAQQAETQQAQALLQPYDQIGLNALPQLQMLTGTNTGGNPLTAQLTAPFNPTQAQLAATPGYQFTLAQGEQAVANGNTAQGLGMNNPTTGASGPQYKGAINYAEGLASTTYNQQFQNYLQQNAQIYGMLGNQVQAGQNAATGVGNYGMTGVAAANQYLTSGAAATAAGTVGSTAAQNAGITGAAGSIGSNALLYSLLSNQNVGQQTISSPY